MNTVKINNKYVIVVMKPTILKLFNIIFQHVHAGWGANLNKQEFTNQYMSRCTNTFLFKQFSLLTGNCFLEMLN